MAFDFIVINALGSGHHRETVEEPGKAAIAHSRRKRAHKNTQARYAENGMAFEPMVFECQGGVGP
eukprot:7771916-Karenia_brevis.AAC.1